MLGYLLASAFEISNSNFYIEIANDGIEAVKKIEEAAQPYDLVITDYHMPRMNGIALADKIRKISPSTRIIMITAYNSKELQEKTRSLDLDGIINKPGLFNSKSIAIKSPYGRLMD